MKVDSPYLWDLWSNGGPFVGENRSNAYVTVEKGWWLHISKDEEVGLTYRPYRSFQRKDNSQIEDIVPNVRSISIERSIDQDAATCTLVIDNQKMLANDDTGYDYVPGQLGQPGYYTPSRGDQFQLDKTKGSAVQMKAARWRQLRNEWEDVFRPNALLRTYQGYGGHGKTREDAIADGNVVQTGTWLVDSVRISTDGKITLECRDMAKLLLEQLIYPPLLPNRLYPLEWYRWRWKKSTNPSNYGQLIKVNGNYCADEETEILTRRGWLRYDEVEIGDEALAVDPDSGVASWQEITDVFREHRQTEMVSMQGRYHDSITTPDHRWLVKGLGGDWGWKTTETLNTASRIPVAVPVASNSKTYSDDLVELIAWFYTEGSVADGRACLSQSRIANPEYADRIESLLRRTYGEPGPLREGYKWNEYVVNSGTSVFRVTADVRDEWLTYAPGKVPASWFLTSLTEDQAKLFVDVSIMADGWTRANGTRCITQKDKDRIRAFEIACVLSGQNPNTHWNGKMWSCTVRKSQTVLMREEQKETIDYEGVIWCPTLKHHNWLARRNGKVYYTGNTDFSEIVRFLLAWSGWWLADYEYTIPTGTHAKIFGTIEQTGTWSEEALPRDLFDKKSPMDGINAIREIVSYLFKINEDGGANFSAPNWYEPGNFDQNGRPTNFIPEIHEEHNLVNYGTTATDNSARSEIIVTTYDPTEDFEDTVTTRLVPPSADTLHGMVRPAMWANAQYLKNPEEQRVMTELIALRIYFAQRLGQAECVANPLITIDDQIRMVERVTSDSYIHYVRSVSTNQDLKTGVYTMNIATNWLGNQDDWAIKEEVPQYGQRLYTVQYQDTWPIILKKLKDMYGTTWTKEWIMYVNQDQFNDTGGELLFRMVLRI